MNIPLVLIGKLIARLSKTLNLGGGSTWPGHIALTCKPSILRKLARNFRGVIIFIAGTNGKTTTAKMLCTILKTQGKRVIHNETGANLLNGITSAFIEASNFLGKTVADYAIFEVDENTVPEAVTQLRPHVIVLLNLFRDQLDRYGEVDAIANRWRKALEYQKKATVILNADDPHIAFIGKKLRKTHYFGIDDKTLYRTSPQHAMDAIYCPNCGKKLTFSGIYFSHLGLWQCKGCGLTRPKTEPIPHQPTLPGIYNLYNLKAAHLVARVLGIDKESIKKALASFTPAFGRQEEFIVDGKKVKIFLSKNPAGFNESIRTVKQLGGRHFLLVLNDRIPDGRDVSWIWDVDFEEFEGATNITVSGERAYDMGVRLKYAGSLLKMIEDLRKAMSSTLGKVRQNETLYILPTYSAMLEVRKILTGRKLL